MSTFVSLEKSQLQVLFILQTPFYLERLVSMAAGGSLISGKSLKEISMEQVLLFTELAN